MIQKAVYTFWEDGGKKTNQGFLTELDLASSISLSLELTRRQFKTVDLVTNTYGKSILIDKYRIPFDNVSTALDQFNDTLEPEFWAYVKIFSYSLQTEPFIHIDNDVFIWDTIPISKLEAPLLFQNREMLFEHKSYLELLKVAVTKKLDKNYLRVFNAACNCGVVGVNDLSLMKVWLKLVQQYIFDNDWSAEPHKHGQNHFFEQYLISSICNVHNIEPEFILDSPNYKVLYQDAVNAFKYTHLWGEAKRNPQTLERVRNRLFKNCPEYAQKFFGTTNTEIFSTIYKYELWGTGRGSGSGSDAELTEQYREYLQKILKQYSIKKVVDLGCGDWQFSKYINWTGIDYTGIDCVPTVINNLNENYKAQNLNFTLGDGLEVELPECDLLIVKDVLIHWSNEQIFIFLKMLYNIKYVLFTNDIDNKNIDIRTGGWRALDLQLPPFNLKFEHEFFWDKKVTQLWKVK